MHPYRFSCFSALAARDDIDLLVVYLRKGSQPYDYSSDIAHAEFSCVRLQAGRIFPRHIFRLIKTLRKFRPAVAILGGWNEISYYLVAALRPILARRVIVWTESTLADQRRVALWKTCAKRRLVHRADAVLVPGSAADEYLQSLMDSVCKVTVAPNAVDNERFAAVPLGDGEQTAFPPGMHGPVFLYVGRLDPEKGIEFLLRAWAEVERRLAVGSLVLVGGGTLDGSLRKMAARLGLQRLNFAGFVPQNDLPGWYRRSDVFVFPSLSDPWGLVINEAMAAGLPVITTSAPGAAADLVADGQNGRMVPPADAGSLAAAMVELGGDEQLRRRMGDSSRSRIGAFLPGVWAEKVADLVEQL